MYKFIIILFLTSISFSQEIKIVDIDTGTVFCNYTSGKFGLSPSAYIDIVNTENINISDSYDFYAGSSKKYLFRITVPKGKWIIILYDNGRAIAKTRVFRII